MCIRDRAIFARSSCCRSLLLASVWSRLNGIRLGGCQNICFVMDGDCSGCVVMIVFVVKDLIRVLRAAFGLCVYFLVIGSNMWGVFDVWIFLYLVQYLVLLFCRYKWLYIE